MVAEPKVLVIDDEEVVCNSCARVLSERGYSVRTAVNGEAGLQQIEKEPFDLVIADLKMPGTDGIGVLRRVGERRPETVVIVITGYSSVESAVEVMKLGAADYIAKPFTPDELTQAAAKALERRSGRVAEPLKREELIGEETTVLIKPEAFREMLRDLGRYVYVPRRTANGLRYAEVGTHPEQEVLWGDIRAVDPLKLFFFGPRTRVAAYPARSPHLLSPGDMADLQRAIAGVKRCDLQALELLDKVFLEGDFTDPFYKAARENTLIVTTDCSHPSSSCSCVLMGLDPFCEEGFDLNISEVAGGLILEAGSDRGREVIEANRGRVEEVMASHLREREERRQEVRAAIQKMSGDFLPEEPYEVLVEEAMDSPVWEKCAESCVGCAGCTLVCPTCHCFLLYDQPDGKSRAQGKYEKIRAWDSCQYAAFAKVAGGANPRMATVERFRHRYLHKFCDIKDAHGIYGCTGCGRCIDVCMGKIDMRNVLWELSGVKV